MACTHFFRMPLHIIRYFQNITNSFVCGILAVFTVPFLTGIPISSPASTRTGRIWSAITRLVSANAERRWRRDQDETVSNLLAGGASKVRLAFVSNVQRRAVYPNHPLVVLEKVGEEEEMNHYDETVVEALVLLHFDKCPPLGAGEFRAKVTWCGLADCPERREANKRIGELEAKEA